MVDQRTGQWYPDYYGQQPWQDPAYIRATAYPQVNAQPQQNQQQPQMMTPPTIRAEIIQVDSPESIDKCQQNSGTTQMYMTKDEQYIVIRTKLANGEYTDVIYDKRPPAPPAPKLNPDEYVRKDEVAAIIGDEIRRLAKAQASEANA